MPSNFNARPKVLGVTPLGVTSATQEHELGHRVADELGNEYVYIQANGAITAGGIVTIDGSYDCALAGNVGTAWAVAVVALTDNQYGWVQVKGVATADVATGTVDNAVLARRCDANGDLVAVGTGASAASGDRGIFAKALAAESGGQASVFIF